MNEPSPHERAQTAAEQAAYWKRYRSRWTARKAVNDSVDLEAMGSQLAEDDEIPTIE